MGNYDYADPFSVCFNILKLKYKDYDESLSSKNLLVQNDKVNVFINLETVFKNLSMVQDLEKKLILQRDYKEILISNIINLAGHYKRFCVNNTFDTKVYLYHTDFQSNEFSQYKYNEDYRSYYLVKYNDNPKFTYLTDALKESILPDVRTYCEFIPNVYYISAKNIEGSLVPYIISEQDKTRKNLIISGDFYDTQYSLLPSFINNYIHRGIGYNCMGSSIYDYLKDMTKKDDDTVKSMENTFQNYSFYCGLISVMGDRIRSIDGLPGVGFNTMQKYLNNGIAKNEIQTSTSNPIMIGDIFHDNDMKEEFVNNYYCSTVESMYHELSNADILSVYNQQIDRFDNNSLKVLNGSKFYHHPIILESLTV